MNHIKDIIGLLLLLLVFRLMSFAMDMISDKKIQNELIDRLQKAMINAK